MEHTISVRVRNEFGVLSRVALTFARRAYELAAWFRQRGARVILGGLHVQSCPDEAAPHADAIAVGDGVSLWPEILRDVAAGRAAGCATILISADAAAIAEARATAAVRTIGEAVEVILGSET